jgi:3-hydroxyisobutyrate dehydrogenase-like beta-hydroxyacid dehydrogenase
VGIGNMGSAFARTLLRSGHPTTVWNRTAQKADAMREAGARVAESAADAVRASPLTVISLLDYSAVRETLSAASIGSAVEGRIIVNLSTGSPEEAEELAEVVGVRGAKYLDGNIGCYPDGVGTGGKTHAVYCGPEDVFASAEPWLATFGSDLRHLGPQYGAGNALVMAAGVAHVGEVLSALVAAAYGRQLGLAFDVVIREILLHHPEGTATYLRGLEPKVSANDYVATLASLTVYLESMEAMANDMRSRSFENPIFDAMLDVMRGAASDGYAEKEAGVLYELFSEH